MKRPTHDWVARKSCGCVVAITYDMQDQDDDGDTTLTVGAWVRDGYTVERMPVHDAVALLMTDCPHTPAAAPAPSEPIAGQE